MSRFLLLYSDVGDGDGPIDPGTLNVAEQYNENTWVFEGQPDWREKTEGANLAWDNAGTNLSPGTQNGLTYWGGTGNLNSLSSLRPFSKWTTTDQYTTLYLVTENVGGAPHTMFYISGAQANSLIRVKVAADNAFYVQVQCTNLQDLIVSAGVESTSVGFHVWAIRIDNTSGAGVIDWFQEQEDPIQATNASWVPFGIGTQTNSNRLFTNNSITENWNGGICEMIIVHEQQTDDEVQRTNAFLQAKWGIA